MWTSIHIRTLVVTAACLLFYNAIDMCSGAVQIEPNPTNGLNAVTEGDNVFLSCRVTGFTSDHTLSWTFDDQVISNESIIDDRFIRRGDDFLFHYDADVITTFVGYSYINWRTVSRFDSGTYSCDVLHRLSTPAEPDLVARKTFIVNVLYEPYDDYPKCTPDSEEIFVDIGQPLALSCISEEGNPRVNLTWERSLEGGDSRHLVGITSEGHGLVKTELSFVAVDTSLQNALFVCVMKPSVATTTSSMPRSCTTMIHVVLPDPVVSITPQVGMVTIDESIVFTLSSHLAVADVRWTTDPAIPATRTEARFINSTHVFRISNIEDSDSGIVVACTVLFKGDWIRTTATIVVRNDRFHPTISTTPTIPDVTLVRISSTGWMIACLAIIGIFILTVVAFIACFLIYRRKQQVSNPIIKILDRNGRTVSVSTEELNASTPNLNRVSKVVPADEQTMGPGEYMSYHRPEAEVTEYESLDYQKRGRNNPHKPLQRVAPRIPPTATSGVPLPIDAAGNAKEEGSNSEMDNPQYMTSGMYPGANYRPVKINDLPGDGVSRNSSVAEDDYLSIQLT